MRRVLAVLALLCAGCGSAEPAPPSALAAAEARLRADLEAVGLEVPLARVDPAPCDDPAFVTGGLRGEADADDVPALLARAARAWRAAGWEVRVVPTGVFATRDGAAMSLQTRADGTRIRLSGGTPCVPRRPT